jgi:hypothetical protein
MTDESPESSIHPAIDHEPPPSPPPPPPASAVETVPLVPAEPVPSPPKRSPARTIAIVVVAIMVVAGIIAVAVASGGGGTQTKATARPAPSPTVGLPVALGGTAKAAPLGVTLTWSAPSGETEILGYLIYRDGTQVGTVPGSTTTYLDTNVTPGETYTYEVVTRGEGIQRSERVTTEVEVPVPSLSQARLEGPFDVHARTRSQRGYVGKLGKFTMGWDFEPKCHFGACATRWTDFTNEGLSSVLTRVGARYSGSDTGKFTGRCGRVVGTSTITIKIRVTKAEAVAGEWRAVKLVGTMTESHPAQFGCVSGGATFSLTLSLGT